ncbi:Leucine-zipper-like transcriptional regulator 1, partial [Entomortierella beljakovae]
AQASFQPKPLFGVASVFIEGKALYIHGGVPSVDAPPDGQTFAIDLSTNWTTSQPVFKRLAPGIAYSHFPNTLAENNTSWFMAINNTGYKYFLSNDTWGTNETFLGINMAHGLSASADPRSGLIYIIKGQGPNNTLEYNPAIDQQRTFPTFPGLAQAIDFVSVWSTATNSLLVHGGMIGGTSLGLLFQYNANSGWREILGLGDVPPARSSHCMVPAYNGTRMVVFGGRDQRGSVLGDVYTLDMCSFRWEKGTDASFLITRANFACAVTNDLLVIWGGRDRHNNVITDNITAVYNLKKKLWQDSYSPLSEPPDSPKTPINPNTSFNLTSSGVDTEIVIIGSLVLVVIIGLIACLVNFIRRYIKSRQRHPKQDLPKNLDSSSDTMESRFRKALVYDLYPRRNTTEQNDNRDDVLTEMTYRSPQVMILGQGHEGSSSSNRNPQAFTQWQGYADDPIRGPHTPPLIFM